MIYRTYFCRSREVGGESVRVEPSRTNREHFWLSVISKGGTRSGSVRLDGEQLANLAALVTGREMPTSAKWVDTL